jgi:hypothetical protein
MLQPKDVFVSQILTKVSLGYSNEEYVADQIFPPVPVQKDTAKIATYGMENLRIEKSLRAPGAPANTVAHTVSVGDHYVLQERAYKERVTDEERENQDAPINADIDATENLTEKLKVLKEKLVADTIRDPSIITQTAGPSVAWSTLATSDPFADVKVAKEAVRTGSGKKANAMIIGEDVLATLLVHPKVVARFPGAAAISEQMLRDNIALLFGLKKLIVMSAQFNSAPEGQADDLSDIFEKDCVVAFIEQKPRLKSRSLGFDYRNPKFSTVQKWRDPDASAKTDWVSASEKNDLKVLDAKCAYLIDDAVA